MRKRTRERILTEAMRLFGENGFAGTTIAQIEAAAGLTPGSGGLYRHFASKDELLSTGLRERIEDRGELLPSMAPRAEAPLTETLLQVCRAGFQRLHDERDVNRILIRDLNDSPELLEFMRDAEIRTNHEALVALLITLGGEDFDAEALAAVMIGAVAHYWLLRDVFGGEHPLDVSEERYLNALVALATAMMKETK